MISTSAVLFDQVKGSDSMLVNNQVQVYHSVMTSCEIIFIRNISKFLSGYTSLRVVFCRNYLS